MRILVVEDSPPVRTSLERVLARRATASSASATAASALRALSLGGLDGVVLDVGLPDVSGLEVCARLRAGGDRVPVLMLTARDAVADRVAGLDAGADDYLVKPFAVAELLARLRALLRRACRRTPPTATATRCTSPTSASTCARWSRRAASACSTSAARSGCCSSSSCATRGRC